MVTVCTCWTASWAGCLVRVRTDDVRMPVCTLAPSEPGKGTSKSVLQ